MTPIMFIQSKNKLYTDIVHCIGRGIDFYSSKYDDFIALGDLNTEASNSILERFCASYNLINCKATCLRYQKRVFEFAVLLPWKKKKSLSEYHLQLMDTHFIWCSSKIYTWPLVTLLLNIFLFDLFLFLHDIPVANYVDDNTPYCTGLKIWLQCST